LWSTACCRGDRLTTLLREFHAQFPTVPVRLLVQTLGGVERVVRDGHARIGVGNQTIVGDKTI